MRSVSFKVFFQVYAVSLLLCVGGQTALKLFGVDPLTGFYSAPSVLVFLLYFTMTAAILFWFSATVLRKARHDFALNYRHFPTAIFSVLTGISIIIYTVSDLAGQVIPLTMSPFRHKVSLLLTFAFGLIAGISLIFGGSRPSYGRYGRPGAILGVFPCLWQLMLLMTRFNGFATVTTVSDVMFTILFMCFATIFLLGQARIIYGLGIRNGRSYAFPAGLAMSLVGLMIIVPNVVYAIFGGGAMPSLDMGLPEAFYITSVSIYAPVFLSGFAKSIHKV